MATINSYLMDMQINLYVNGKEKENIKKSIDAIYDRLSWYFGVDKKNNHIIIIQCYQENMIVIQILI